MGKSSKWQPNQQPVFNLWCSHLSQLPKKPKSPSHWSLCSPWAQPRPGRAAPRLPGGDSPSPRCLRSPQQEMVGRRSGKYWKSMGEWIILRNIWMKDREILTMNCGFQNPIQRAITSKMGTPYPPYNHNIPGECGDSGITWDNHTFLVKAPLLVDRGHRPLVNSWRFSASQEHKCSKRAAGLATAELMALRPRPCLSSNWLPSAVAVPHGKRCAASGGSADPTSCVPMENNYGSYIFV